MEFCGNSDLMNLEELWNSNRPVFSKCFLKILPFWIPAGFLWFFAPIEIYVMMRSSKNIRSFSNSISHNYYNVSRLISIIFLLLINLIQLVHDLCFHDPILKMMNIDLESDYYSSSQADITSSILNLLTYILFAFLTQFHRRKGKSTSGVAWIFTFLSWISFTPIMYTFLTQGIDENNNFLKIGFVKSNFRLFFLSGLIFAYAFKLTIIFLLTCFADRKQPSQTAVNLINHSPNTDLCNSKEENFVDSFELNSPYELNENPIDSESRNENAHGQQTLLPKSQKILCPKLKASFLSRIIFWWFNDLAMTGFQRSLKLEDLWELEPSNLTRNIAPEFDRHWLQHSKTRKIKKNALQFETSEVDTVILDENKRQPGIVWALTKTFGYSFLFGAIFKLGHDILQFASPQLLRFFITFVKKPSSEEPIWHGYFIASLFFIVATIQSLMLNYYFYMMFRIGMQVRTVLVSAVYRKSLKLSNSARKKTTTGEIINLMSVDAQRFVDLLPFLNLLWSSPLQILLATYFLWIQLGPSVLAGLVVMVLMIPINGFISSYQRKLQMKQMKKKDERVKVINELLNGIRVIKLYAWEIPFIKKVDSIRSKEIEYLKKIAYLHSTTSFLWTCAPFMVSFVTFGIYVLSSETNVLDPEKAFVSLALFNLLRFPMSMLPMMISMLINVSVSIKRLNQFLNSIELENYVDKSTEISNDIVMKIENGCFSWDSVDNSDAINKTKKKVVKRNFKNENDVSAVINEPLLTEDNVQDNKITDVATTNLKPSLNSINLEIKKGSLVAVVGHVGSGKSSLLSALLGDMEYISGKVNIDPSSTIAYVAQQAWIQNVTLKENILFGSPFNKTRYDSVIEMCALKPDIAILPGGDETEIGEKGINLSGGQKQRVSIARACYTQSDIILMDDPLSAVDSHVAKHIFQKVISSKKGFLKDRTRILVTNNLSFLAEVDQIIVLNRGSISETGTYQQLMSNSGKFAELMREYSTSESQHQNSDSSEQLIRSASLSKDNSSDKFKKRGQTEKLIDSERTETGGVKLSVYLTYFRSLTYIWLFIVSLGFVGMQTASVFSNVWLAVWSNDVVSSSNITQQDIELRNHRLSIYGILGLIQALCVVIGALAMANGVVNSSKVLHHSLLGRIMRSPIQFFDTTPMGRVVNRFSKDVDTIDSTIPHTLRGWFICFLQVVSTFVLIIIEIKVFMIVAVPILLFYYLIQKFYVTTSRQLKRLESVTRSPIYSHFGETLQGVSTIRAYDCSKRFIQESNNRVDINQKCYFPSFIANRWLAVRLEFCGNVITLFSAVFAVISRNSFYSAPGFAGLIMSYALNITQTLNWLIRMTSEMETNVVSVERIDEYCQLPTEREWTRSKNIDPIIPMNWPEKGEIKFSEFAVRYRDGMNIVLNNISINVLSGEKIGIVGRTGAGKSTLTLSLFRLLEGAKGSIEIDDIDIGKIGLHELRSRLSVIPQDPILFSGTIRSNLDPFGVNTDEQLWIALAHSHLKEYISSLESGLDYPVSENGENLSVGQRQLICLARALLRKTKILILDEATAAIDLETDALIQQTIKKEFANCTILTIAHRLNTIIDSNRVLVLDKGKVVEFDSPQTLLADPRTRFYALAKDARII
ncbi:Multidrug resistance-associated protein 1 [Sarcoptes scabiei]|nr:Multidrug resistance-associated protein 1 [Sarcoptes scabiei]